MNISQYFQNGQDILEEPRKVIRESVPEAEETISYGMSTFKLNGNLVHFAHTKIRSDFIQPLQQSLLSKRN